MHAKLNVILLIISLFGFSQIKADHVQSGVATQANLLNFMKQNRDLSNQHPQRSLGCFGYYVPILNKITTNYENNYALCVKHAEDSHGQINATIREERSTIQTYSKNSCDIFSNCNENAHPVSYLECYVNGGTENSKTMYNISVIASKILFNIREKYQLIQNDKYRCTNESERIYVKETADTFTDLQECILGRRLIDASITITPDTTTNTPEIAPTPGQPTSIAPSARSFVAAQFQQRGMPEKDIQHNSILKNVKKFKRADNVL